MLDELVGDPDIEHRKRRSVCHQQFIDGTATAACDDVFLHRHEGLVPTRHFKHQRFVERFDEAHVDQCGIEPVGKRGAARHEGAKRKDGKAAAAFPPDLGFTEREGAHLRFLRKTHQLVMNRDFCLTRRELGRKMTEAESGICLWWDGDFTAEEIFEVSDHDLRAFKRQALAALRR